MAEPTPTPSLPSVDRAPPDRRRRRDLGSLLFGLILLAVGVYFLLKETLGILLPDIGELWPVFVIGLGLWILISAMRGD